MAQVGSREARARNAIFDRVACMFDCIAAFVATATAFDAAVVAVASTAVVVAFAAAFDAVVAVASTAVITVSASVVAAVADAAAFAAADATVFAAAIAAVFAVAVAAVFAVAPVFTATAAGTTVAPVHGSRWVLRQALSGYYRRLLPMVIFGCMAQGCFAVAPDAKMVAQLAQLSSSFGLAVLLTGLASIAVTPTARKLISIAADACSVTSDSPPDDAATCSEKEGVAPTPLTVKKEGAALPPGLNVHAWPPLLTAVSGPCTRSNKEGVAAVNSNAACDGLSRGPPQSAATEASHDRRTLRSTRWARRENTEWAKQPRRARPPVYTTAHCARVWLQRTLAALARRRDTVSQAPVPILRDVGFNANSSMFMYRDAQGHTLQDPKPWPKPWPCV